MTRVFYHFHAIAKSQVLYSMFTINRFSKTKHTNVADLGRRVISTFIISGVIMMGLTGCGQKGNLYLADASSQTVQGATDSAGIQVVPIRHKMMVIKKWMVLSYRNPVKTRMIIDFY